jgi:hypothetical protein
MATLSLEVVRFWLQQKKNQKYSPKASTETKIKLIQRLNSFHKVILISPNHFQKIPNYSFQN